MSTIYTCDAFALILSANNLLLRSDAGTVGIACGSQSLGLTRKLLGHCTAGTVLTVDGCDYTYNGQGCWVCAADVGRQPKLNGIVSTIVLSLRYLITFFGAIVLLRSFINNLYFFFVQLAGKMLHDTVVASLIQ